MADKETLGNPSPLIDPEDLEFAAEIAQLKEEQGSVSDRIIEARWLLRQQALRCAAGDHVYTASGKTFDLPGGSPHLEMACAYEGTHFDGTPSPRLPGPLATPENLAEMFRTEGEISPFKYQ